MLLNANWGKSATGIMKSILRRRTFAFHWHNRYLSLSKFLFSTWERKSKLIASKNVHFRFCIMIATHSVCFHIPIYSYLLFSAFFFLLFPLSFFHIFTAISHFNGIMVKYDLVSEFYPAVAKRSCAHHSFTSSLTWFRCALSIENIY